MTGSSSKAFAAVLFALLATSALAATPPHDTGPTITGAMDTESADDKPNDAAAQVAVTPSDAISETTVSAPPIDGFGTLEQGKGALPSDIWKGSTRDSADPLLQALRSGIANETLQTLLTHLLMTQATPPQGNAKTSWFQRRIDALIAIGEDDKAQQMIGSLPGSMADPSMLQTQVELQLARGEYDHACEKPPVSNDLFWRKLTIFCKAQAGKQDEAMVGLDLMREEQHGADDAFFQEAIRRIGDKTVPIKANPKQWTLFDVALVRAAGDTERLKDRVEQFPPVAVKYIAQDGKLDIKLREKATARAQQLGVLPENENNKTPEPVFARPLASDVATLVAALGSDKPANDSDNAVIARLALDETGVQDSRRVQRLLTLMEPFGYRVAPEIWQKLLAHPERFDGDMPSASLVARINDAAATGRRGEVIVLANLIVSGDVEREADLGLLPVIKALQAAGFEKEARQIAYAAVKSYSGR